MRKNGLMIAIIIVLTALLSGCQKESTAVQKDSSSGNLSVTEKPEAEKQQLTLFYGDEQAEYIIAKEVSVDVIDDETILAKLAELGILSEEVKLNSKSELDSEGILHLDFNQAFQEEVMSMGTSGERILVGSVVNTFLTAYEGKQAIVTVNGAAFESGHCVYDGPLSLYSPGLLTTIGISLPKDEKQEEVEFTKEYCEMGIAVVYPETFFTYSYQNDPKSITFTAKEGYATISLSEFNQTETIEGLKLQAKTDEILEEKTTVSEDKLTADCMTLTNPDTNGYRNLKYYVFTYDEVTYLIEQGTTDKGQEELGQILDVMFSMFRFVK